MKKLIVVMIIAILFVGCGKDGGIGPAGLNGTNGTNGTNGATGPVGPVGPGTVVTYTKNSSTGFLAGTMVSVNINTIPDMTKPPMFISYELSWDNTYWCPSSNANNYVKIYSDHVTFNILNATKSVMVYQITTN